MADDHTLRTLGTILLTDMARDAIHIAVAPIVAPTTLRPGEHVNAGGDLVPPFVGIVDPYLKAPVQPGQRCWLYLYPGSITSLRHHWTHVAFGEETLIPAVESCRWIEVYAAENGQTYDSMMAAADEWREVGEYTYDNSEAYKHGTYYGKLGEFWRHYEIVRGVKVPNYDDSFFTCTC